MRVVIQRVSEAAVRIDGQLYSTISRGLLVLIGIEHQDTQEDADWIIQKLGSLRIFNDDSGKMNHSVSDVNGQILVVSQFTLHASTKKGNRPSYMQAAPPDKAIPMYDYFVQQLRASTNLLVETGVFGADMKVFLINDGPVTILMDSKNKV